MGTSPATATVVEAAPVAVAVSVAEAVPVAATVPTTATATTTATALVSETAPVAAVAQPAPAPETASSGSRLRVGGIVCGAAGVASIATAIYFYTRAVSLSDRVSNSDGPDSDYRAGKNAEKMQWVFYSAGAGALLTGSILYYSGEYKDVDLVASDPKDNPIVSAALEMQAQYVVTLDASDLLRLKVFLVSGHRPVQIESPAGFLRLLER